MEDIAARAGISVGTLYNYFQDRSALVGALLELRTSALLDGLDAAVDVDAPFRQRLGRFVQALADHFEANRALLSVLLEDESSHGRDAASGVPPALVASGSPHPRRAAAGRGRSRRRAARGRPEGVRGAAGRDGARHGSGARWRGRRGLGDAAPEIVTVFLNGAGRR